MDPSPVSCELLDLEQHGDNVEAMVGGESLGDLVVSPRDRARLVEAPVAEVCRQGGPVCVGIVVGVIDAVEQITRYLDCIRADSARAACRGILAAQQLKPQAVTLAESRGIRCVQVDLAVLRGEREPDLTLFAA